MAAAHLQDRSLQQAFLTLRAVNGAEVPYSGILLVDAYDVYDVYDVYAMSTSRMPEYGTSAPLTARSVKPVLKWANVSSRS